MSASLRAAGLAFGSRLTPSRLTGAPHQSSDRPRTGSIAVRIWRRVRCPHQRFNNSRKALVIGRTPVARK
jgi:hypothetical protein